MGGEREREEGGDRAEERRKEAPHGRGTLALVHEDSVRSQLGKLPRGPGVYLFRGERDDVLYVGKAKSLRARVRSYFNRGSDMRVGIDRMVDRIQRIEVIVTQSEAEALHLEQNLVKRHRPPFNVRLRDDKSFPYIAVTVSDPYPRVMFTRERHRRGTVYFGPYANAKKVRETLDVLNRVFQFRPCEGPKPGRHSGIPCLDFHIERCTAPCVGAISEEDYGTIIDGVIEFLSGETRPIRRELERRMREAAAQERFEEAARYRNRLFAVESLAQRQAADKRAVGTIDVIGLAVEGDRAAVQLFPLRDGKMVDRFAFHLENVEGQDRETILESFCVEHYGSAPAIPPQVIVPPDISDTEALASFLGDLRGARVEVRAPQRGEKRRLAELAEENARLALEHDASVDASSAVAGGSRRSRSSASPSTSRACRRASSASTCRTSRGARSSPRWRSSSTRIPAARTTARSPCVGSTGRTTSPRWRRSSRGASPGSVTPPRSTATTRASRRSRTSS